MIQHNLQSALGQQQISEALGAYAPPHLTPLGTIGSVTSMMDSGPYADAMHGLMTHRPLVPI
ncbi:MAG: hypothetical protein JSS05_09955 [Proteobacteria bacterium]|nr:hypothetical protein [Pseudomonadota bacterium]